MRAVNFDCRYYLGYKPCAPHKERGVVCNGCPNYERLVDRIAIVKLGAIGDVLRTTALLPDIRARHNEPRVSWITLREAKDVLVSNPLIDEIIVLEDGAGFGLDFDAVYVLDNSPEAVRLGAALQTSRRYGFRADRFGRCNGVYEGCDPTLFGLGLWDDYKRANRRSYLDLLAACAGVSYSGELPFVPTDPLRIEEARDVVGLVPRPLIGINTDAGARWLRKQWNLSYVERAVTILVERGYSVVLLGGRALEEWNADLAMRFPNVLAPITSRSVRDLFAYVSTLDVLLTGDTLAMHAAWGLRVPLVALFGPTALDEITLGAADAKIAAQDLECLGCYLHTCSVTPHCMDRLEPDAIVDKLLERLRQSQRN